MQNSVATQVARPRSSVDVTPALVIRANNRLIEINQVPVVDRGPTLDSVAGMASGARCSSRIHMHVVLTKYRVLAA